MSRPRGANALHHVEHGRGTPLVALHGAGVDHREIEAALEGVVPRGGYRRIYPDLPGMGRSSADGIDGNDAVVDVLAGFVETVAPDGALVLGHSYGAYLARGLAARRPDLVLGLALVCPVDDGSASVPEHRVVESDAAAHAELDEELRPGFDEYFVVRTPATARRYRDAVAPGVALADHDALGRVFAAWAIDLGSEPVIVPTLIVAGRCDSVAGHEGPSRLAQRHPGATLAVLDDAGHALMHECPDRFAPLLDAWMRNASR